MKRQREPEDFPSDTPTKITTTEEINHHSSPPSTSSHSPPPHSLSTHSPHALSTHSPHDHQEMSEHLSKIVEIDDPGNTVMKCAMGPHPPLVFNTYGEYESHFQSTHMNRCLECGKNFPSEHILGMHIEEVHDSYIAVKRDRGDRTFTCFVEGCERKCSTAPKRNRHVIDKHHYPANYFFDVVSKGIDGRNSMLKDEHRPRRHPKLETHSPEKPADTRMEELTEGMSALQFVPNSVRFGRGERKGFSQGTT